MNRVTVTTLVLLGAVIFGLVFLKQVKTGQEALAEYFYESTYPSVAGSSITAPPRNPKSDNTDQIERDASGFDFSAWETETERLEDLVNGL